MNNWILHREAVGSGNSCARAASSASSNKTPFSTVDVEARSVGLQVFFSKLNRKSQKEISAALSAESASWTNVIQAATSIENQKNFVILGSKWFVATFEGQITSNSSLRNWVSTERKKRRARSSDGFLKVSCMSILRGEPFENWQLLFERCSSTGLAIEFKYRPRLQS